MTLPHCRAPAFTSLLSRPLATVAGPADWWQQEAALTQPQLHVAVFAASLHPAFLPGPACPASSWGRKQARPPPHPLQGGTCVLLSCHLLPLTRQGLSGRGLGEGAPYGSREVWFWDTGLALAMGQAGLEWDSH